MCMSQTEPHAISIYRFLLVFVVVFMLVCSYFLLVRIKYGVTKDNIYESGTIRTTNIHSDMSTILFISWKWKRKKKQWHYIMIHTIETLMAYGKHKWIYSNWYGLVRLMIIIIIHSIRMFEQMSCVQIGVDAIK